MRLISLTLENFMSYLGGPHTVALDRLGLVLLSGANLDDPANNSNGAGKSTILEALTWGLFGEGLPRRQGNAERGVSGDEVCPDRLGKQTRVELELEDELAGQKIGVVRWRKYKAVTGGKRDSGVSIRVGGAVAEQYLDTTEGDKRIRDVLGINRDIWCRSVIFGQESQFNFCEATSKDRADILTTVMGLEVVDRWLGRARDERTQELKALAKTEGALEATTKQYTAVHQNDPAVQAQGWEDVRTQRLAHARRRLAAVEEKGRKLKGQLEGEVEARARAHDAQVEEQAAQAGLTVVPVPQQPDHGALDAALAALEAARRAEAVATTPVQRLNAVQGQATCPTCYQVINPAGLAQVREDYQRQLVTAQAAVVKAQAVHQEEQAKGKAATEAVNAQAAAARTAALQRIQAAHAASAAAHALVQGFDIVHRDLEAGRADWRREAETIKGIETEVNPYKEVIDQRHLRLHELGEEIKRLEAERSAQQETIGLLTWWDQEIPRFKTWLFDGIVDSLAAEANRWLRVMSAGVIWVQITTSKQLKSGDIRDDLDVQVFRWNPDGSITSRPYRIWSGGEKRRVALAVDLGLSRLMATRASKAYRFLALDEIDRHLDTQGREGLRAVLEELKTERETCLVCTHDAEFRASFDLELAVTKEHGTSRMEVRRADSEKTPHPAGGSEKASVVQAGADVRPARKKGARGAKRAGPAPGDAPPAGGVPGVPGSPERGG